MMERARGARPALRSPWDPVQRVGRCPTGWRRCPVHLVPLPRVFGGDDQLVWGWVPNWLAFSTWPTHRCDPGLSLRSSLTRFLVGEQLPNWSTMRSLARWPSRSCGSKVALN